MHPVHQIKVDPKTPTGSWEETVSNVITFVSSFAKVFIPIGAPISQFTPVSQTQDSKALIKDYYIF